MLHLYVETMDATLVEYAPDGRVRFENEEWRAPSLQEARAIMYAARQRIEELEELLSALEERFERSG